MLGDRIRELRQKNSLSQGDLAKKLNISRTSVNVWENGGSFPTVPYIIAMAKLFHVTTDYILEMDSPEVINVSNLSESEKKILLTLTTYMENK